MELLWRMKAAGFQITEVPIQWQNKDDSRVRNRDVLRMLNGLLRIRFGREPV
jgi:hypothetical protein